MQIQLLMRHCTSLIASAIFYGAVIVPANADNSVWQFAVGFGQHRAGLENFNDGVLRSNVFGYADIVATGTNAVAERRSFRFDVPIDADVSTPKTNIELIWRPNHRHHLVFGLGYWEARGEVSTSGEIPTEGTVHGVLLTRRAKLSYSDFYVGWQFNALRFSNFTIYNTFAFDEIYDIDYTDELLLIYTSGSDLGGSSRNRIANAQTTAALGIRAGIGVEINIRDVFFLGIEGGYLKGINQVQLKPPTVKSDFQPRDFVVLGMPYGTTPDGKFGYQAYEPQPSVLGDTADNSRYRNMPLSFDGWMAMARIGIKF